MKRHNRLKVTDLKDKGFTKSDWADFWLLIFALILLASVIFAGVTACIRLFTEVV